MKWDLHFFLIKLTSRKFWVWLVTTAIAFSVFREGKDHAWITPVVWIWGVITFIYICGEIIVDSIAKAIEKADIKIGVGGGGR